MIVPWRVSQTTMVRFTIWWVNHSPNSGLWGATVCPKILQTSWLHPTWRVIPNSMNVSCVFLYIIYLVSYMWLVYSYIIAIISNVEICGDRISCTTVDVRILPPQVPGSRILTVFALMESQVKPDSKISKTASWDLCESSTNFIIYKVGLYHF